MDNCQRGRPYRTLKRFIYSRSNFKFGLQPSYLLFLNFKNHNLIKYSRLTRPPKTMTKYTLHIQNSSGQNNMMCVYTDAPDTHSGNMLTLAWLVDASSNGQ